jgi:hypothetical protein
VKALLGLVVAAAVIVPARAASVTTGSVRNIDSLRSLRAAYDRIVGITVGRNKAGLAGR